MHQSWSKSSRRNLTTVPMRFARPTRPVSKLSGFQGTRWEDLNFEPGWRWSECIKPVVGTDSCQVSHVGYAVSGRLTVKLNDGTQKTIEPGMSYTIPPGHNAWVEGNERFICMEVMSAEQFAKA